MRRSTRVSVIKEKEEEKRKKAAEEVAAAAPPPKKRKVTKKKQVVVEESESENEASTSDSDSGSDSGSEDNSDEESDGEGEEEEDEEEEEEQEEEESDEPTPVPQKGRSKQVVVAEKPKPKPRAPRKLQVHDTRTEEEQEEMQIRRGKYSELRANQRAALKKLKDEQALVENPDITQRFDFLMQQVQVYTSMGEDFSHATKQEIGKSKRGRAAANDETLGDDILHRLTVSPPYLKGTLRPYQIEGVNWLISLHDSGLNGILADEMGLGKTFQSIAVVSYLKLTRGLLGPHLVMCPLSVLQNWVNECHKWCPDLNVLKFHGYKDEKPQLKNELMQQGKYDVIVTTYEMAIAEKGALSKIKWKYLIVDEAHRLKSEESLTAKVVRLFSVQHRVLVTGTPLQNNLHELWALLNFLLPDLFDDATEFDAWFDTSAGVEEKDIIGQLHKMLKPFMIRRLKVDVDKSIPPKKEIYVGCGMSALQREWYQKILAKDAQLVNTGTGAGTKLLNILMQLRKCCCHPYLFPGVEVGPPYITDDALVNSSGKMCMLDKLLSRLKAQGHRVLLFSQMTRMLDIIEDYLIWKGLKYHRLDGSTNGYERQDRMDDFNDPKSEKFIFILSTRAGGLGVNLYTADTVILYDSDWNPQMDLQAQDRAHRIGQTKPVTVFRFICDGTIDEKVYHRALKKLYLDAAVIQQGQLQEKNKAASKEELLGMIRFGAEAMFKSKDATITDEDIDIILERGEETIKSLEKRNLKDVQTTLANFSLGIEDKNMYQFEGVNYTDNPTKTIYINGIDETVEENTLRQAFGPHGDVAKVIISPTRDTAAVQMRDLKSAIQAMDSLKSSKTIGECTEVELMYGQKGNLSIINTENIVEAFAVKGKRACAAIYNERNAQRYQEARDAVYSAQQKGPRLPKFPKYPFWQFYDVERLQHFHDIQCEWVLRNHAKKVEARKAKKLAELEKLRNRRGMGSPTPGGDDLDDAAENGQAGSPTERDDSSKPEPTKQNDEPSTETAVAQGTEGKPQEAETTTSTTTTNGIKPPEAVKSEGSPQPHQQSSTQKGSEKAPISVKSETEDSKPTITKSEPMECDKPVDKQSKTEGDTEMQNGTADNDNDNDNDNKDQDDVDDEEDQEPEDSTGAKGLTSSEVREKEEILNAAFIDWTRSDYSWFVRAACAYGRDELENIAKSFEGTKTLEAVKAYSEAFWREGKKQIPNFDQVLARINKGEEAVKKRKSLATALKWKAEQLQRVGPAYELTNRVLSLWDEDADRSLLLIANKYPIGDTNHIKADLMEEDHLTFDWMLHSRTPAELSRRIHHLGKTVEAQKEGQSAADKAKRATRGRKKQQVET